LGMENLPSVPQSEKETVDATSTRQESLEESDDVKRYKYEIGCLSGFAAYRDKYHTSAKIYANLNTKR